MAHDFTSAFYFTPPREEPSSPATDRLSNYTPDLDPRYWLHEQAYTQTPDEEYQPILPSQRRDVNTIMSDEGYESFSTSQYSNGNTPLSISDEEYQSDLTSQYSNGNGAMPDEEYQPGLTPSYYIGSTIMSNEVDQIPWEVSNFPYNEGTTDLQTQDNQRSVSCTCDSEPIPRKIELDALAERVFIIIYKYPVCLECLHKQDLQTQDNQRNVSYGSKPTPCETTVVSCLCNSKRISPVIIREEETQKLFIIYKQQMCWKCIDEGLRVEVKDRIIMQDFL